MTADEIKKNQALEYPRPSILIELKRFWKNGRII